MRSGETGGAWGKWRERSVERWRGGGIMTGDKEFPDGDASETGGEEDVGAGGPD